MYLEFLSEYRNKICRFCMVGEIEQKNVYFFCGTLYAAFELVCNNQSKVCAVNYKVEFLLCCKISVSLFNFSNFRQISLAESFENITKILKS